MKRTLLIEKMPKQLPPDGSDERLTINKFITALSEVAYDSTTKGKFDFLSRLHSALLQIILTYTNRLHKSFSIKLQLEYATVKIQNLAH